MLTIIALILAIPTYGLSLVLLVAYWWYQHKKLEKNLKSAIQYLLHDSSALGTCFDEINYKHAAAYLNGKATKVRSQIGYYIEYEFALNQGVMVVILDKEPNGSKAILNASLENQQTYNHKPINNVNKKDDWRVAGAQWLNQFNREHSKISVEDFPRLKEIILGSAAYPEFSKDIQYLPKEICKLKLLEKLHLQNCNIKALPNEISNLTELKHLKLGGNSLVTIPDTIAELPKLEILTMWMNRIEFLPENIGDCKSLKGLDLSHNPISYLPDSIVRLNKLTDLYMSSVPNLQLTVPQKEWVKELRKNGCEIYIDESLLK